MLNNYLIYFYQSSKESGLPNLIPHGRIVLGILTIIGTIKAIREMLRTGCTYRNMSTEKDGTCTAAAFLRCINGADLAQDFNTMKKIASKYDIEVRVKENKYYIPASLDSKGYKYIKKTVEKIFDYAIAAPFILPAGTDARRFTELTDATIRFAPIDIDSQQYASVHGENENISVDKIYLAVNFYKEL